MKQISKEKRFICGVCPLNTPLPQKQGKAQKRLCLFFCLVTLQIRFCLRAFPVGELHSYPNFTGIQQHVSDCGKILTMEHNLSIRSVWMIKARPPCLQYYFSQSPPIAHLTLCKQPSCRNISQALFPFTFHSFTLPAVQLETPAV